MHHLFQKIYSLFYLNKQTESKFGAGAWGNGYYNGFTMLCHKICKSPLLQNKWYSNCPNILGKWRRDIFSVVISISMELAIHKHSRFPVTYG